eukprot:3245014-Pyramimonas_sp.AAC.1
MRCAATRRRPLRSRIGWACRSLRAAARRGWRCRVPGRRDRRRRLRGRGHSGFPRWDRRYLALVLHGHPPGGHADNSMRGHVPAPT